MKRKISVLFIILSLLISLLVVPTFADATTVVTIGQDLSDEQEAFIIKYFGVDLNTAEVIYVNNQQEREYVGSWIPLEQIGNITISSAYVQPTRSGGIQVKTANLTYVTGNMIASVLSTAGVKNCNVVAAAPFPVSGTGALTGVMIAYQQASNAPLEDNKRELAIQEFTMTQQISESIDENEALQLVNAVKLETIQQNPDADNREQIENIVNQVINNVEVIDNSITNIDNSTTIINNGISDEDKELLVDFAEEIARQDYQYDEVVETLKRVEENLQKETNISIVIDNENENIINNENNNNIDNESQIDSTDHFVDFENLDSIVNEPEFEIVTEEVYEYDEPVEIEESILENTNDGLIDINYQSSTRLEDIEAIEQEKNEISEEFIDEILEENDDFDIVILKEFIDESSEIYDDHTKIVEGPEYEEMLEDDLDNEEDFVEMDVVDEEFPFKILTEYSIRIYSEDYINPEDVSISLVKESGEEITIDEKNTFSKESEVEEFVIETFIPEGDNYISAHIQYQEYDTSVSLVDSDRKTKISAHEKADVTVGSFLSLFVDNSEKDPTYRIIDIEVDDEFVTIDWQDVTDDSTRIDVLLNATGDTSIVVHFYDEFGEEIKTEYYALHIYEQEDFDTFAMEDEVFVFADDEEYE